ncbi:MAG: penicillin-insensitive murein endopeptidase [Myxococcales bacterium]|nr:penicillin-insensitive murein endopeptidase [Myxococcales bacterium]
MLRAPTALRWLCAAAVSLAAAQAEGAHPKGEKRPPAEPPSVSVGSPNHGVLVGGRRLEHAAHLRVVGAARWGLPELVGMLERGAARVARRFPKSVLTVGDLSRRGGGEVGGHNSHESGRDADVAFYLERRGKAFVAPRFATIDATGRALRMPGVEFDDARNWALVEAWLSDPEARVLQIFVVDHLRTRLLAYAARSGASASLQARAAAALLQPRHATPHDNHFHVRIACPRGQAQCVDYSTKPEPSPVARGARPRAVPKQAAPAPRSTRKGDGPAHVPAPARRARAAAAKP